MALRKSLAQVPIRNRGENKCPDHNKEEVILACIDCGGELICPQCIASKHKTHKFENISQVADKKKKKVQEYVHNVEKSHLPTITNKFQFIDQQMKDNTKRFKWLEKEITSHGEKMKEEIDRITKEMIQKCKEIERQNSQLLNKYKKDLKYLYTQLNQIMEECKDILRSDNNILIIDVEKDIHPELKLTDPPKCTTLEFTGGPQSPKHIQDGFGSLSVKGGQILVPQKSHHATKSDVVKQHISVSSTVESEFKHSTSISSMEKSTSNNVWLSYNNAILLVTIQGEIKHKLEVESFVSSMSVSPVTGNLWLCCFDNAVYEVSGDEAAQRFATDSCPKSLCMTPDNNVVVVTSDDIRVYSTTGQVLHSTDSVVLPGSITVCISTGDIAVCDSDLSGYGGKGKSHVSVFNSNLDLKYQYYGPPKPAMESRFWPKYVVYDTQGRLLITDNKCIQLVSSEGQFLTVVHTDTLQPTALTLIQDGVMCVGFLNKKVKVIRYRV